MCSPRFLLIVAVVLLSFRPLRAEKEPVYQGRPLSVWTEELYDKNPEVRVAAAKAVGQIGPQARSAAPNLIALLVESQKERLAAAEALGRIGPGVKDLAAPFLVRRLRADETSVRLVALSALFRMGTEVKEIAAPLRDLLRDEDPKMRRGTARVLRRMGSRARAAADLLARAAAQETDENGRVAQLAALICINPRHKSWEEDVVTKMLAGSKDLNQRLAIALLLRRDAAPPRDLPALVNALQSWNTNGCRELGVVTVLSRAGKPATAPLLRSLKEAKNPYATLAILHALRCIGPDAAEAVPRLRELCEQLSRLEANGRAAVREEGFFRPLTGLDRKEYKTLLPVVAYTLARIRPADCKPEYLQAAKAMGDLDQNEQDALTLALIHRPENGEIPWSLFQTYPFTPIDWHAKRGRETLQDQLKAPDLAVRTLAAYRLAQDSPKDRLAAIATLTALYREQKTDEYGRRVGLRALFSVGPFRHPLAPLWLSPADPVLVAAICDALREKEPGNRFPNSYVLWWLSQVARTFDEEDFRIWDPPEPLIRGLAAEALRQLDPAAARKAGVPAVSPMNGERTRR